MFSSSNLNNRILPNAELTVSFNYNDKTNLMTAENQTFNSTLDKNIKNQIVTVVPNNKSQYENTANKS